MSMDLWFTEFDKEGFGQSYKVKKTLFSDKSEYQTVDIIETETYGKMLVLDGLIMTSEKDEFFYHEMISHIPMLNHPNPKSVLVIGGGDGGTVREVLKHKTVENVVLCEIDGMVIDASKEYLPTIAGELDNPKVDIQVRDGVEFIKEQKGKFDIILIDSTDPMGPGVGLFTEEFYNNVNAALKEGGIMAAQSESPVSDKAEIKALYPLLKKAFPIVEMYTSLIPTYPGGYWSWSFCSNTVKPLSFIDEERAKEIEKQAKLYNIEYHKRVFALPNFVKNLLA